MSDLGLGSSGWPKEEFMKGSWKGKCESLACFLGNPPITWTFSMLEDALELVDPNWRHPGLSIYAVSRLAQATDEDLKLYLLQLVQALNYENFKEMDMLPEKEG